jgi:hypothetical protein
MKNEISGSKELETIDLYTSTFGPDRECFLILGDKLYPNPPCPEVGRAGQ